MDILIVIACSALGAILATWRARKSPLTYGLGIACGVTVAFAVTESPWYLLALAVLVPLVISKRKVAEPR